MSDDKAALFVKKKTWPHQGGGKVSAAGPVRITKADGTVTITPAKPGYFKPGQSKYIGH